MIRKIHYLIVLGLSWSIPFFSTCQTKLRPVKEYPRYEKAWAEIDSLVTEGLYRQAAGRSDSLFEVALQAQNHPQMVHAAFYHLNLLTQYEEDIDYKTLEYLKAKEVAMSGPSRPFWQLGMATRYLRYLQANTYRLQHTEMNDALEEGEDIKQWSRGKLVMEIDKHLSQVLIDEELKLTSIEQFEAIVAIYDKSTQFRPTVFDFLIHEVIGMNTQLMRAESGDYYWSPLPKVQLGAPYYELRLPTNIQLGEETRLEGILRLYQDVEMFHASNPDRLPLLAAQLNRLQFVHQHDKDTEADSNYSRVLGALLSMHRGSEGEVLCLLDLARHDKALGDRYNLGATPEYEDRYVSAMGYAERALKAAKDSVWIDQASLLIAQISQKNIQMNVEQAMSPNQEHLLLTHYRNVDRIYFKQIPIKYEKLQNILESDNRRNEVIGKLKKLQGETWILDLPDKNNHQQHAIQVPIRVSDLGHYVLMASTDSMFSVENEVVALRSFWASEIGAVARRAKKNFEILISNRTQGDPIVGAQVKLFKRDYNYQKGSYERKNVATLKSDSSGFATGQADDDYGSYYLDITKGEDRFNTESPFYLYNYYSENKDSNRVTILTDRGIYRPGQDVHFKAILYKQSKNIASNSLQPKLRTGVKKKILLLDYNQEVIDSLELTTNEYGSVSGTFSLPQSMITGNTYIEVEGESSQKYLRVEEYKRPKFFLAFEPIESQVRLGDTLEAVGVAKGYAGNRISGASVSYQVTRNINYPYWFYWRYTPTYEAPEVIMTGKALTGDDGSFEVNFVATEGDQDRPGRDQAYYSYSITATVTDQNGETHQSSTWVYAGKRGFSLSALLGSFVNRATDSLKADVFATNLNGQLIEGSGMARIYALAPNSGVKRSRLWQNPDRFAFSEEEHERRFPLDIHSDSSQLSLLDRPRVLRHELAFTMDTVELEIELSGIRAWETGEYLLELSSTDDFGNEILDYQKFDIVDAEDSALVKNELLYSYQTKTPESPGEELELIIGSAAAKGKVLVEFVHNETTYERKWVRLENEQKSLRFIMPEGEYGYFQISLTSTLHNRHLMENHSVYINRKESVLEVELSSFRNKVYPGSQEEWTLSVVDHKEKGLESEVLAAMYDASLDAFAGNYWGLSFFEDPWSSSYWDQTSSFSALISLR